MGTIVEDIELYQFISFDEFSSILFAVYDRYLIYFNTYFKNCIINRKNNIDISIVLLNRSICHNYTNRELDIGTIKISCH